jgi:hypothetical protein
MPLKPSPSPFDWLSPEVPSGYRATFPAKREAMIRRELGEHAALLYRLGYPAEHAKHRLRANLAWEHELHPPVPLAGEVDGIVDEIWRRGGVGAGVPTV